MSAAKLSVSVGHLLANEMDVDGQPVTFLSALLKLANYPLKSGERLALFNIRRRVEKAIKQREEFLAAEITRLGGELTEGGRAYKFPSMVERDAYVASAKEAAALRVGLPLTAKLEVSGVSDGSFETPDGVKHPLTLPDLSRLDPIIGMPEDAEPDDVGADSPAIECPEF